MKKHRDAGLTIPELIVTMAIAGVLATLALVVVQGGDWSAKRTAAASDAQGIAMSVAQIATEYRSFGDTNGHIGTDIEGMLTFAAMTNADPNPGGPGTTDIKVQLTEGSIFDGSYGAGSPGHWCIHVQNGNQDAVVTEKGNIPDGKACNTDGTYQS